MVDFKDLKFYKSAGGIAEGLGGGIDTTKEIASGDHNNLFDEFDRQELIDTKTEYRCFFIKNTSAEKIENILIYESAGTRSGNTYMHWGFDSQANRFDGTVGFDGVDDYIDCTSDTDLWSRSLAKFSFSVDIYPTLAGDGFSRYVVAHGDAGTNNSFYLYIDSADNNKIVFAIKDNSGVFHYASSLDLDPSDWNHVSCSYDNSLGSDNQVIYVGGVQGAETSNFTGAINLSTTLLIAGATNDLKGYMRDFKFWYGTRIDTNEAEELFETGEIANEAPGYHLHFSERTGTTVTDSSSGTKVATLTNGTFWKINAQTTTGGTEPDIYQGIWYKSQEKPPAIKSLGPGESFPIWCKVVVDDDTATPVLDDSSTFTINFDISGSGGGTGTTGGGTARTIKTFNGTSTKLDEPDAAALDLNKFTLSAWFRTTKDYHVPTDDPRGEEGILIIKGEWSGSGAINLNYGMWVSDLNRLRGGYEEADDTEHIAVTDSPEIFVNDGNWHQGVLTNDGTTVKIYCDGVLHGTDPSGATPITSSTPLRLGANNYETDASDPGIHMYFKGDMDDVYVWNVALTQVEITSLYNNGFPGTNIPQESNIVYSNDFSDTGTTTGGGGTGGGTGGDPNTVADWKIAFTGDEGCEPETNDMINLVKAQGYDLLVSVGDHAYESASCWTGKFNTIKDKMEGAFGNHEYSESGGTSPYKNFFGYGSTHASVRFQNVLILIIDDNDFEDGSAPSLDSERSWALSELQKYTNDSKVTWRIAVMHHPWFGSGSKHPENEGGQVQKFHKMFTDNGVNFLYMGHNHNWQRTHQLGYNSSNPKFGNILDSSSPYSRSTKGLIGIVSGTGGHDSGGSLYSTPSSNAIFAYLNKSHNGVHELVATNNGNTLTGRFRSNDGDVFDTFTITA